MCVLMIESDNNDCQMGTRYEYLISLINFNKADRNKVTSGTSRHIGHKGESIFILYTIDCR